MVIALLLAFEFGLPSDLPELRVSAGDRPRIDALVEWLIPPELSIEGPLVAVSDGATVPVQIVDDGGGRRLVWPVEGTLNAGSTRDYSLEVAGEPATASVTAEAGGDLIVSSRGREVLRYHVDAEPPPAGVDPVHTRSGFIHPLRTPLGLVVTGDAPPAHRHQRGLFLAWTRTTRDGRSVDFWNLAERQGRVDCAGIAGRFDGPWVAGFVALHHHVDLTAKDPIVALTETWRVTVRPGASMHVVDVATTLRAAATSLAVEQHHYGGFAWRGPAAFDEGATFRSSADDDRLAANGRPARWCAASGEVDGTAVTVAILVHPESFRAPQPVRIHPDEPYFCFAPCQAGRFDIDADGVVMRYRVVVADGSVSDEAIERLADEYESPPRVERVR